MLLGLVWLKECIIESMEKDFDAWNFKKKELDKNKRDLLFKEGEIWWCSLGLNIGEEATAREWIKKIRSEIARILAWSPSRSSDQWVTPNVNTLYTWDVKKSTKLKELLNVQPSVFNMK